MYHSRKNLHSEAWVAEGYLEDNVIGKVKL